jgi:hypothetical protein
MNIKTKLLAVSLITASFLGAASAQTVDAEAGYVSPQEVEPNTTVSNQEFNVVVENLSADGDTDHVYFEFPHFLNESLSPNTVDTNISVSSSKSLVDQDDDGVKESVHVGLSRDGEGAVTGNITLDIGIDYPAEFDSFPVDVKVNDSRNGADTTTLNVENVEAADEETSNETEDDSTSDSDTEDNQESTDNTTDDSTNTTDDSNTDETENNESTDDTSDSNTDETEETNSTEDEETSGQESQNGTEDSSTPEDSDSSESDEGIVETIISFFTGLF